MGARPHRRAWRPGPSRELKSRKTRQKRIGEVIGSFVFREMPIDSLHIGQATPATRFGFPVAVRLTGAVSAQPERGRRPWDSAIGSHPVIRHR